QAWPVLSGYVRPVHPVIDHLDAANSDDLRSEIFLDRKFGRDPIPQSISHRRILVVGDSVPNVDDLARLRHCWVGFDQTGNFVVESSDPVWCLVVIIRVRKQSVNRKNGDHDKEQRAIEVFLSSHVSGLLTSLK
ncbi:MAG: hypothetical protein WC797_04210, partial [Candidatus Paceibacterota bacterium]